jgi:hypothetical protein
LKAPGFEPGKIKHFGLVGIDTRSFQAEVARPLTL